MQLPRWKRDLGADFQSVRLKNRELGIQPVKCLQVKHVPVKYSGMYYPDCSLVEERQVQKH